MKLKRETKLELQTLQQLKTRLSGLMQDQSILKMQILAVNTELVMRTMSEFTKEMIAREKEHGSFSKTIDGVDLTYEVKQTVSWDQPKLRTLWEALPREIGDKLIKTEFSVSEAIFKNQVDPGLIDALVDARTTKLSAPSIKLK